MKYGIVGIETKVSVDCKPIYNKIPKRLKDLETNPSEKICTKITISKKSVYRQPSFSNIDTFFLTS